jgi:outer membrane protein OmpA-like peptidoglycan-associated protein
LGFTDTTNPLVQYSPYRRRVAALVESRFATELTASVGLLNWVQLFGTLPVTLYQDRGRGISNANTSISPLQTTNLGDVRLGAKIRLLRAQDQFIDVALIPQVTLPIGLGFRLGQFSTARGFEPQVGVDGWAKGYTSEGFPTLQPEIAVSRELFGVFLGVNGGLRLRRPYEIQRLNISQEALVRGGLGFKGKSLARHLWWMKFFPVEAGVEMAGSTSLNLPYVAVPYVTPAVRDVSLKTPPPLQAYQPSLEVSSFLGVDVLGIHPYAGAALGLVPGYGTPDWRIMGGLRFATDFERPFPPGSGDRDHDGTPDTRDVCPDVAGPASSRGCPPEDDDGDGVVNALDRCPQEMGPIHNGRVDGCPPPEVQVMSPTGAPVPAPGLPDRDGDGIPDVDDRCPQTPEDLDGYQDADGCPENDNDGDGIPDAQDRCPLESETLNGFQDEDGCPDQAPPEGPDSDGDGVPNERDRCPYETGRPKDGCPNSPVTQLEEAPAPLAWTSFSNEPGSAGDMGPLAMQATATSDPVWFPPPGMVLDTDGDGIPDGEDACPRRAEDVDGFEDDDGCPDPDNDGDGIPDALDQCPLEAEVLNGLTDEDGCPDQVAPPPDGDADGDGVKDGADRCPFEPRAASEAARGDGCPDYVAPRDVPAPVAAVMQPTPRLPDPSTTDTDGDGIMDDTDACPQRAEDKDGFADEDGCPDPDNDDDGILDVADRCPLEAETLNLFQDDDGCPDSLPDADEDVIPDDEDRCPYEPGDREDGCAPAAELLSSMADASTTDSDGDGIMDTEDACPQRAEDKDGFEDEDGCPEPDNDHDGVADVSDRCPLEAEVINGVKDEDGCPDKGASAVAMEKDRVTFNGRVNFQTARAVLTAPSKKLLKQVAVILKAYPDVRIYVDGHTDDVGSAVTNQKLSEQRAKSVAAFLASQGIDARRLEPRGFGRSQPLQGGARKDNRRVEFLFKGETP